MKKGSITLAVIAVLAALAMTAGSVMAAEPITVPTVATIHKGLLIDEYPGPPPKGTTDLVLPFYGKIVPEDPACRVRRKYELGKIEADGEFSAIGITTVPESGKWTFGLAGEVPRQFSVAVRVPSRQVTYKGALYQCGEAISASVIENKDDFTPCDLARAAKRGYGPAIRTTKQNLRKAEARHDEDTTRAYREQLEKFRSYLPSIERAVKNRC